MDLNKLKLTDGQKACLIAVSVSDDGLSWNSGYDRAFNLCSLLGLLSRGPRYTEKQQAQNLSNGWLDAEKAVKEKHIGRLRDAISKIEDVRYNTRKDVYRLTPLGQEWIDLWKAKQTGVATHAVHS